MILYPAEPRRAAGRLPDKCHDGAWVDAGGPESVVSQTGHIGLSLAGDYEDEVVFLPLYIKLERWIEGVVVGAGEAFEGVGVGLSPGRPGEEGEGG